MAGEIARLLAEGFINGEEVMAEKVLKDKVKASLAASGRSVQGWARAWKSALEERCEEADGGFRLKPVQSVDRKK